MKKEKKEFKPFKSCTMRMADSTWDSLKANKLKSGLSWNRFITKLLEKQKWN